MEKRDFWFIPLNIFTDEVMNISYISILGDDSFESIKIPTTLNKFASRHLLRPNYLLHGELVKTRKNWIFKHVLEYRQLLTLNSYQDYVKMARVSTTIMKHLYQDQDTSLLSWLIDYYSNQTIATIQISEFETLLLQKLGFK